MTGQEKTRWKNWADDLRQKMMMSMTAEVTKTVETITTETATTKSASTIRSARFWRACQSATGAHACLATAGFEIEFQEGKDHCVQEVTFRLNSTWMTILDRVLDRKRV